MFGITRNLGRYGQHPQHFPHTQAEEIACLGGRQLRRIGIAKTLGKGFLLCGLHDTSLTATHRHDLLSLMPRLTADDQPCFAIEGALLASQCA